jgi:hypothetical protein
MLLISIVLTVFIITISAYYYWKPSVKTTKQADRIEDVDVDLIQFLPIISNWSSFYISQLQLSTVDLITKSDKRLLIYNLTIDILAKSILSTTTDALASQLVSPVMTISLIRLNDMLCMYDKRKRLPYYLWLYHDLWDGSISMANNTAFLKSLVHRAKRRLNVEESCLRVMVDMGIDEERIFEIGRDLFIDLMDTVPDSVYEGLKVVDNGMQYFNSIDNLSSKDNILSPKKQLNDMIVQDLVMKLAAGFAIKIRDDDLLIENIKL